MSGSARYLISVASNLSPAENIPAALRLLTETPGVELTAISAALRTAAVGRPEQPDYINCVAELVCDLRPRELKFGVLRRVEAALGRRRSSDKYASRVIDLDILALHGYEGTEDGLRLPEPEIAGRTFLASGVRELWSEARSLGGELARLLELAGEAEYPVDAALTVAARAELDCKGKT